ncbi:MAG: hypothetical protein MRY32_00165 [Rickettsiales bacterium]|nr:hypothetical protein [Rickettsiales bacterium]
MRWYHRIGRFFLLHFLICTLPAFVIYQTYDSQHCTAGMIFPKQSCIRCENAKMAELFCNDPTSMQRIKTLTFQTFFSAAMAPMYAVVLPAKMWNRFHGTNTEKLDTKLVVAGFVIIWFNFILFYISFRFITPFREYLKNRLHHHKPSPKTEVIAEPQKTKEVDKVEKEPQKHSSLSERLIKWLSIGFFVWAVLGFIPLITLNMVLGGFQEDCSALLQGSCAICKGSMPWNMVCNTPSITQSIVQAVHGVTVVIFTFGLLPVWAVAALISAITGVNADVIVKAIGFVIAGMAGLWVRHVTDKKRSKVELERIKASDRKMPEEQRKWTQERSRILKKEAAEKQNETNNGQ